MTDNVNFMPNSVFISYSRRESPLVDVLLDALEDEGLRVWVDYHSLVPGLALEEALLALLHGALGDGAVKAGTGLHRAVERARECLAAQPQDNASLAQIATLACCSPFHLARAFRRYTGTSLHAYRTRLRMVSALQRIEQGERQFAALAVELGYSSHSHFSATFARHFGCSPRQLRTNLTASKRH